MNVNNVSTQTAANTRLITLREADALKALLAFTMKAPEVRRG